jgi:hypothetical protein
MMKTLPFSEPAIDSWADVLRTPRRKTLESLTAYRSRIALEMVAQGHCAKTAIELMTGRPALDTDNLQAFSTLLRVAASARRAVAAVSGDFHDRMRLADAAAVAIAHGFESYVSEEVEIPCPGEEHRYAQPRFELWARPEEGLVLTLLSHVTENGDQILDEGYLYAEIQGDGPDVETAMAVADRAPRYDHLGDPIPLLFFRDEQGPAPGRLCRIPIAHALRFLADIRASDHLSLLSHWSDAAEVNLAGIFADLSLPRPESRLAGDEWAVAWSDLHPSLRTLYIVGDVHGITPHDFQAGRRISQLPDTVRAIMAGHRDFSACLDAYRRGRELGLAEPRGAHPEPAVPPSPRP